MVEVDQYARYFSLETPSKENYTQEETQYFRKQFSSRLRAVDEENTNDLKELLQIYTWFKISEFGKTADSNAWLITQHADHDVFFQKSVLAKLSHLWPLNETNPSNYAYLFDRVAASWHDPAKRIPQRYGTQGFCMGKGLWRPLPIEQPEKVDERRAMVGLPPLREYIESFREICKDR